MGVQKIAWRCEAVEGLSELIDVFGMDVFGTFDGIDDSFQAAFTNYPYPKYLVFLETLGKEPRAIMIALQGAGVITGYIDATDNSRTTMHDRRFALLQMLRTTHERLIVHDADDDSWLDLGFVPVPCPPNAAVERPGRVYALGMEPSAVYERLALLSLPWPESREIVD